MASTVRVVAILACALATTGCSRSTRREHGVEPVLTSAAPSTTGPALDAAGEHGTVAVDGLDALEHKPLLLLFEQHAWTSVTGSDAPTVALYEDGLAIVQRGEPPGARALAARAPEDVRALVGGLVGPAFLTLPARTSIATASDQPTVSIVARAQHRWKLASVYGLDREGRPTTDEEAQPPAVFVDAYRKLLAFEPPGASPWVPAEIDVRLADFSHSKRAARPWPAEVPRPAASVIPPEQGSYEHFLDARFEAPVQAFLASLGDDQGVALNGHTWSMRVRRVIPEEAYIEEVRTCAWRRLVVKPPAPIPPSCH